MKKRLPHRGYIPRAQSPSHLKLIFTIIGISSNLGFTRASHAEAPTGLLAQTNIFHRRLRCVEMIICSGFPRGSPYGLLAQTNIFHRRLAMRRGDRVGRPPELMMYSLLHE